MRQRVVVGTKACALSRSGTIELADVIHHHAFGVETRDQRLHRVLADAYPFWRIAGVIQAVIERHDLIFEEDRTSVVSGKRSSVRVDIGGRSIIKKKQTNKQL